MSGPIPPDPGYSCTSVESTFKSATVVPRIKPEAKKIAALHHDGTMAQVLNNKSIKVSSKKKQKNHIKENVCHMCKVQPKIKLSVRTNPVQEHILAETLKYDSIQSKVSEHMKHCRPYSTPVTGPRVTKNFITLNKRHVKETPVRILRPTTNSDKLPTYKIGEVPKYLQERKKAWLKQKEIEEASLPDPSVPDGHILMPLKDKVETLRALQFNKKALIEDLLSIPIACHTLKHKQKKEELEYKLSDIDDAIKIFSRPKVFIKAE